MINVDESMEPSGDRPRDPCICILLASAFLSSTPYMQSLCLPRLWVHARIHSVCQTLTTFFSWLGEGGPKYHYERVIIGPPAKRRLNGVSLACRSWPNIECWLGSFMIFLGIRTSIVKKPYIFAIFQGGGSGPLPPSGSAHRLSEVKNSSDRRTYGMGYCRKSYFTGNAAHG